MNKLFIRSIIYGCSVLLSFTGANAYEHQTMVSVSRDINQHIGYNLEMDYRFDGDDIFRRHYQGGFDAPIPFLGKGWSISANYRQVYTKNMDEAKWSLEKRPHFNLKKVFSTDQVSVIPALKWIVRDRHEYRMKDNGNHVARQRLLIRLKSEKKYFGLKPFIGNEMFYDFDDYEFNQNRVLLGFDLPETNHFKSSLYLKYKTQRNNERWEHGTSSVVLKIKF